MKKLLLSLFLLSSLLYAESGGVIIIPSGGTGPAGPTGATGAAGAAGAAGATGADASTVTLGTYTPGAGTISSGDTYKAALQKVDANKAPVDAPNFTNHIGIGTAANGSVGVYILPSDLTGVNVWGALAGMTVPGTATTSIKGFATGMSLLNTAFTVPNMWNFFAGAVGKGGATTLTRFINYGGDIPTVAANNANISDNNAFTGNWFINQSGTEASKLGGTLTVPVISSGTASPATTGYMRLANTDEITFGTGNMSLSANASGLLIKNGGIATNNSVVYDYPTIGLGAAPAGPYGLYIALSVLTGTRQAGVYSAVTGNSANTGSLHGFQSAPTTGASTTTPMLSSFNNYGMAKGAGGTVTRAVAFYSEEGVPTAGTNNAVLADNASFTGQWGINIASGAVSLGGTSLVLANLPQSSAATQGTLCWQTGGVVNIDTTLACLASTREVKEEIEPLDIGLKEVMKLKPVSYQYKPKYDHGEGRMIGLVAEDVEEIDPRLVTRGAGGKMRGVRYMQNTALLVKAIQELKSELDQLRNECRR